MSEQRSFQQQSQESFQSSNSFQQTSSVRQQEVYEATERDGAMRGYQPKGVDETGRRSAMARDSGLFGGIGGDDNSLVDNEFDYKNSKKMSYIKYNTARLSLTPSSLCLSACQG